MKTKIITNKIMDYVYEKDSWLYWKKLCSSACRQKIGSFAGNFDKNSGYYRVCICGKFYLNHRILYQIYNNIILTETDIIDHIDGDTQNNSKQNLRIVTNSQNQMNSNVRNDNKSTGIKNISILKQKDCNRREFYYLNITKNGNKFRKYFRVDKFSLDEVIEFRDKMLLEMHGEFARYD